MIISKQELLDLYEDTFDKQEQASEINKAAGVDLKSYAENQKLNVKAVKAGYKAFKEYRKGNVDATDDDFVEILSIVEAEFGE